MAAERKLDDSTEFADFEGITNNEAYKKIFMDRMMLPHPTDPSRFLGNTQREDFLPKLIPLVMSLPEHAQLFDFGCGGGEIVDIALKYAKSATVHLEEPNTILLEAYRKRLLGHPHLREGKSFDCPIELLYHGAAPSGTEIPADGSLDLILNLHMIYHITHFRDPEVDAAQDIDDMLTFQYRMLKPGGAIFLVYADDELCTTARASRYYFEKTGHQEYLGNLRKISDARTTLLKRGQLLDIISEKFPDTRPEVKVELTSSWVFGKTKRDMAILCLLAELGDSDNEIFDTSKLEVCSRFIDERSEDISLGIEERDIAQKGMWRFFQPQVIFTLKKG